MMKLKIYSLLIFLCSSQALLTGQEVENRFIPESAFAMIDFDIEQIKQQFINAEGQFVSEYFPSEVITTMGDTYLGFDLMAIRSLRIVVARGPSSLSELRFGLVYEFDKALDIGDRFTDDAITSKIDNVPVYIDSMYGLECMQLNEKTILHATPDFMSDLVNARDVSTPLTKLLAESKAKGSEILGVMSFEQIKDDYAALVDESPIPQPMTFLNGVHQHLKSAEFRVANHMMTLDMLSKDEKSAGKLRLIAKRLVGMGKKSAQESVGGMMIGMGGDPVSESMVAYLERIVESMAAELAPVQNGNQVTMKIKTDAAWFSLVVPMMFGFF